MNLQAPRARSAAVERNLRAAAGWALAGVGHAVYAPLAFGFSVVLGAGFSLVTLGLLAAAAGTATLSTRGRGLLALGLAFAAAGYIAGTLDVLSGPGLYKAGFLLLTAGVLQGAWFAVLWNLDAEPRDAARAASLRLSAVACCLGAGWFLALNLADALPLWGLGSALLVLGFALVAREFGPPPAGS